jgi:hypothetical protein
LKALCQQANEAAPKAYAEGRAWLVAQQRSIYERAMKHFEDSNDPAALGKAIAALREIGRLIGAYQQPEDGQAKINIEHVDQVNQQPPMICTVQDDSYYGRGNAAEAGMVQ